MAAFHRLQPGEKNPQMTQMTPMGEATLDPGNLLLRENDPN
jgi:hypothetical protein